MMKNSEWGAVAYLSQSKYGKYGNSVYDGTAGKEKEVYINNCSKYITGIAGDSVSASNSATCTNTYETETGWKASTTGNIYGIYDMSGGAYEYVMGYLTTAYTKTWGARTSSGEETDSAKFASQPEAKYFDAYTSTIATTACNENACNGHALGETSGWYGDTADFVSTSYPWFLRGGYYVDTSNAGMFHFSNGYGSSSGYRSFRVVLAPTT